MSELQATASEKLHGKLERVNMAGPSATSGTDEAYHSVVRGRLSMKLKLGKYVCFIPFQYLVYCYLRCSGCCAALHSFFLTLLFSAILLLLPSFLPPFLLLLVHIS
jgi:hypothetical protein